MSTAEPAVLVQSIDNPKSHIHRPRARGPRLHKLFGLMLGLSLLVPMAALQPPGADARASSACSGWHSTTTPPNTIRVLRHRTGRVEVVNFEHYVVTVMGKEWPSYLPYQLIEAGAVAVKQYAWYKALDGHQRITRDGHCFDVRDGTSDQLYKPHRARVRAKHFQAVRATWGVSLRKRGEFFMTGYRRGAPKRCGRDATGYKLFALSAAHCAKSGKDWRQILNIYYGPGLDIIGH